jgi:DnaK suppressor protein
MPLSCSQKQQIKILLQSSLVDLKEQITLGGESSKTVILDQTMIGRVSRIDAIQQQKIAQAGFERDKRHFHQLKKALQNINSEDFGYCMECDQDISFSRLMVKPESSFCVSCQQNKE